MSDELPKCRLCGAEPAFYPDGRVACSRWDNHGKYLTVEEWRRLHGPRLAPEHVEAFVALNDRLFGAGSVPTVGGQTVGHEIMRVILTGQERCTWTDAIRAALAALGKE